MLSGILLSLGVGLVPTLIALFLPRRKTVAYGGLIFNILNRFLLQKGYKYIKDKKLAGEIVGKLETTLVDLSYGIFLESKNYDLKTKEAKLQEYLR